MLFYELYYFCTSLKLGFMKENHFEFVDIQ
jgi:hypothetical protein